MALLMLEEVGEVVACLELHMLTDEVDEPKAGVSMALLSDRTRSAFQR